MAHHNSALPWATPLPVYAADKVNLITDADDALIEVGDDFGFDSDIEFFGDLKTYSPSQGSDV